MEIDRDDPIGRQMRTRSSGSSVGIGGDEEEEDIDESNELEDSAFQSDKVSKLPSIGKRPSGDAGRGGGGAGAGGGDAMSALLASYYGLADDDGPIKTEDEIDCAEFSAESYVRKMLQREGLESLLNKDDELVQEVKRLDSDMQMLVYENYSKFISATDTIRKMKNNVNDMKSEMDSLVKNMEGIASRMNVVNNFLAGKRAKVDKLVAVRRLLKRLDFLFDLPINLTRYVQRQDYVMAVTCYRKAIGILRQHAHLPSFKSIQRESDQIINGLKDELQKKMQEDCTAAQLSEYVKLLMDLGIPKADLQATVLKAYKSRFVKQLQVVQQEEDKRIRDAVERGTGAELGFAMFVDEAITRLDKAFLKDFEEAVDVYRGVFLEGNGGIKASPAYTELLTLVRSLFGQYIDILRKLFKANLSIVAQGIRTERLHDEKASPIAPLRHLLQGIKRIHILVRDAGLLDTAVNLCHDVVKGLIFLEFRGLQTLSLKRLQALHGLIPKCQPGEEDAGPPLFSYREQLDRVIEEVAGEIGRALEALQAVIKVAEEGNQALESMMVSSPKKGGVGGEGGGGGEAIRPGLPDLGISHNLWQFLTWLADASERLAAVTFRLTENDVVEVGDRRRIFPERFFAHPSSFSSLIDTDQAGALVFPTLTPAPQYALIMAALCRETQNQLVQRSLVVLNRVYPATAAATAGGNAVTGANKLSTEDMIMCLNGSASRLLAHFVEVQGNDLSRLMKVGLDGGAVVEGEVTQATWGRALVMRLEALVKEVGSALGAQIWGIGLAGGRRGERTDIGRTAGGIGSRKGVHVDIERIFTVKVQVFGPVEFASEPILLAVSKVACKALIELTRQATLSRRGYVQLQVDVQLVRQAVGSYVKDASVLETLLEETLISAGERCMDSIQGIDPSLISSIVSSEYTRLFTAAAGAASTGVRR